MSEKKGAENKNKLTKYYYAICEHNSHDQKFPPKKTPWVSKYYTSITHAQNAQRMHNNMNGGHAAAVASISK